jgi:soluble cytochrome b562
MLRKLLRVTLASTLGAMMALVTYNAIVSADDKDETPTIKEIMKKGHKKTEGYIDKIKADAKDGKWDEAKDYAKTLAFFGESLGKNKPPKGEGESWEKLTKKYADTTKSVVKAVDDKDAKAVNKALSQIDCKECHSAHK